jgi:hypothetical protein
VLADPPPPGEGEDRYASSAWSLWAEVKIKVLIVLADDTPTRG